MNTALPPGPTSSPVSSMRALLAGAALLSVALWYIPGAHMVLYPIRLFVTFIHEGGHALLTVLTGGSVDYVTIAPDTSGLTLSRGGTPAIFFMAGYVGATAYGAFCLQLGRTAHGARNGLVLLGGTILLITGLWVRVWHSPFAFVTGVFMGAALMFAARTLSNKAAAFLLSFLAVQLSLNAIFDLRTLLWLTTQTNADNDAVFMAREYGLSPWFWSLLWAGISGAILAVGLRSWWRATK